MRIHSILLHQLRQFMFTAIFTPKNIKGSALSPPHLRYDSERNIRGVRMLTADCEGRRSIAHQPFRPHFSRAHRVILLTGKYTRPPEYCTHPLQGAAEVKRLDSIYDKSTKIKILHSHLNCIFFLTDILFIIA